MGWTNEQLHAINDNGSLLVSASAGSGKTAVLTERIVRLVREGASISRMLVVTYTKAAASEMKKRIGRELLKAAALDAENSARLRAAAADVGRANISTIHSFLAQVLRRHFHEAGIDPAFRILDEALADALREEALSELMEDRYSAGGMFPELVRRLGGDDKFVAAALRMYQYVIAQAEPEQWLDGVAARFYGDEAAVRSAPELEYLLAACRADISLTAQRYRGFAVSVKDVYPRLSATMLEHTAHLYELMEMRDCDGLGAALRAVKFKNLDYKGLDPDTEAMAKALRKSLTDTLKKQKDRLWRTLSEETEFLNELAPVMEEFSAAIKELIRRYQEKKLKSSHIDYGDMEHMTLKLFNDPAIAGEYRGRFDHIFVDEYQDANRVQERIIEAIRRPGNLFLVGDVKQSIYRFRMAEPGLFLGRMAACDRGLGSRVDLVDNFRSSGAVIDAVNAVFSRVMSAQAGELDYDDKAALRPGIQLAGSAELYLLTDSEYAPEDETVVSDAQKQAALAAELIHRTMREELYTDPKTGEKRPYRFGDFAVLSRATRSIADEWAGVLSRCGIPAYSEVTGGYFDAVEIKVLMDLLRVIDNRYQDIPLVSVLRSPIGGFTTEELIELRLARGGSLIEAMYETCKKDTLLGRKARRFTAYLDEWREDARLLSVEELVGRLMDETGYYDFVSALPGGERRANLDAFVDRARAYQGGVRGLNEFISFMERIEKTDRLGNVRTAGQDVVQILSIHRSKGLEYPAVILAGMEKGMNFRDTQADLLPDENMIGVRYIKDDRRFTSLMWEAVKARSNARTHAEEMRVLYVGMTRAVEKLFMIGSVHDMEKLVTACAPAPCPAVSLSCNSPLKLVMNALLDTKNGSAIREAYGFTPSSGGPDIPIYVRESSGYETSRTRLPEHLYLEFTKEARQLPSPYDALFCWVYPHIEDTRIPAKVSVSELTGNMITMRRAPQFILDRDPAPTDRGTAAHALMEHITLKPHTKESVLGELKALVDAGKLTPEQAQAVDASAVADFFDSPLGRRMIASNNAQREREFNIRVSARRLTGAPTDETILLQGIIDCCFEEPDGCVIIDYKTDRIPKGGEAARAQHHREQIELYDMALTALTGKRVKERYIHFLYTGVSERV